MTRKEIIATLEDIAVYWSGNYEFNEEANYIVFDKGLKIELIDNKLIIKRIGTKEQILLNIILINNIFVDDDKLIIEHAFRIYIFNILN